MPPLHWARLIAEAAGVQGSAVGGTWLDTQYVPFFAWDNNSTADHQGWAESQRIGIQVSFYDFADPLLWNNLVVIPILETPQLWTDLDDGGATPWSQHNLSSGGGPAGGIWVNAGFGGAVGDTIEMIAPPRGRIYFRWMADVAVNPPTLRWSVKVWAIDETRRDH